MIKRIFLTFVLFLAFMVALFVITEAYGWARRKLNRTKIGPGYDLLKILRSGDYVSIDGRVMMFNRRMSGNESIDPLRPPMNDNMSCGGELMFDSLINLRSYVYLPSALRHCDFVVGKYGVKWAADSQRASDAERKVKEAYR